ncbi:MAG: hypothetical protein FWH07_00725 [Oscillospiraceae bacterium]|nr:hypothetical protein [Oscillospiraceae bacterium]
MRKIKKITALFIAVPFVLVSIAGLISLLNFWSGLNAETNAEAGYSKALGITALVGEYNAFLTAAAELDAVKAAAEKSDAGRAVVPLLSAYAESGFGIYDILITNSRGDIFASYTGDYNSSESFRDVAELTSLAPTPVPVSGFYEGGRFYCAKPIKKDGDIIGYIILKARAELISDYVSQAANGKSTFAVFDESGTVISSTDTVSATLRDSAAAYSDRSGTERYELFEKGGKSGAVGNIEGTRWRWISLQPVSTATSSAFSVFAIAFAVAGGVCAVNAVAMIVIIKKGIV